MGGIAVGDFEHVASHDDADDIVERFFVHGEAGEFGVHDEVAQFFEGGGGANGDDVGTRSHHVTHALIAKFDDGFDQAGFVLFDDSLFGGGVHEGFDGLLLLGGGSLHVSLLGQMQDGDEEFEDRLHRPDDEKEDADERNEGQHPFSGSASQQKGRQELHGDDDFGAQKKDHLDGRFPGAGDEKEDTASGDGGDENQPEAREHAEGERGAVTVHVEARLDFGFEYVEVVTDAAGVHAAEFAEGAVEVGKDDEADGEGEDARGVEEDGHGYANPRSRRRRFSRRVIWPWSDSWS